MIRLLLALLAALGLGAYAAHALRTQAGYVLIHLGDWSVETSLAGLLLATLVLGFSAWLLLRLLAGGMQLPEALRGSLRRRRQARAWQRFEQGCSQFLRGDYTLAERNLARSARDLPAGHLAYLTAARAAQGQDQGRGQDPSPAARREHYLQTVIEQHAADAALAELVRAELALERGDAAAARDAAIRACQHAPCAARALTLRAQALCQLQDWDSLHALLTAKSAATRLDPARIEDCWLRCQEARLALAATAAQAEQIKRIHAQAPERIRQHARTRLAYARALAKAQSGAQAGAEAAAFIVATLEQDWDSALVECYGTLVLPDPLGQLAQVEHWLATHGERVELLLAAGRCCLRNRLWGKARSYLQAAQRARPGADISLELARLSEQTGQPDEALQHYRSGLELATRVDD